MSDFPVLLRQDLPGEYSLLKYAVQTDAIQLLAASISRGGLSAAWYQVRGAKYGSSLFFELLMLNSASYNFTLCRTL